jgi:hypothetical protein
MNKDSLTAELLTLAQTSPGDLSRSKAARLRSVLPAVESALSAGASREQVLHKLAEHGLEMTLAVFNTTLRRLRATGRRNRTKEVPATPTAFGFATMPIEVSSSLNPTLHNPSEPVDMEKLINVGKMEKDKK